MRGFGKGYVPLEKVGGEEGGGGVDLRMGTVLKGQVMKRTYVILSVGM